MVEGVAWARDEAIGVRGALPVRVMNDRHALKEEGRLFAGEPPSETGRRAAEALHAVRAGARSRSALAVETPLE